VIDARDQVGTPIITDCPTYVTFEGKRYEIPAAATCIDFGPIKFEADGRDSLLDKLYRFAPYPRVWND